MQSLTSQPFHAFTYPTGYCDFCAERYISFLSTSVAQQQPLSYLYKVISAVEEKYSRRQLESAKVLDRMDPGYAIVSSAFVTSLKVAIRGRRRLLSHPDRCTCHQWIANQIELEPTKTLLCVRVRNSIEE